MTDNKSAFASSEYDAKIKQTIPYYDDIYVQVLDLVKALEKDKMVWLDIGCGTGKVVKEASEKLDVSKFVLCDTSESMLKQAKYLLESSIKDIEFLNCSAQQISFADTFDVITAIQVNHYLDWDNRIAALQKCYDALKNEGLFITFENIKPFTECGTAIALTRWKNYQIQQGKDVEEAQQHINRYGKDYYPITFTEHLEIMKVCGFKSVEVFWVSFMQVGLFGIK